MMSMTASTKRRRPPVIEVSDSEDEEVMLTNAKQPHALNRRQGLDDPPVDKKKRKIQTSSPPVDFSTLFSARMKGNTSKNVASRQAACEEALAQHLHSNFQTLTSAHVKTAFYLVDEHHFGGSLSKALVKERRTISFTVSSRMTQRAGQLKTYSRSPKCHELGIASSLMVAQDTKNGRSVTVNGLTCTTKLQVLLRVIEHEMIHLMQYMTCLQTPFASLGNNPPGTKLESHGKEFQLCALGLFGHKAFQHDLVTVREIAAVKHNIMQGCKASFLHNGQRRVGKVNRVTKRATVLVRSDSDERAARQFSDGYFYMKFFVPIDQLTKID
eukprot:m.26135 g.26135  ORF g.26135 m.26135 type:complete len:327 (+) comp15287_c1_seq1:115-1095(+)